MPNCPKISCPSIKLPTISCATIKESISSIKGSITAFTGSLSKGKIATISALAASALACSGTALLSAAKVSVFAAVAPELFLAAAGTFFVGAVGYTIYCYLAHKKAQQNQNQQKEEKPQEPVDFAPPPPPEPLKLSLYYAMRLFKNYSPALVEKHNNGASFGAFLEECGQVFPNNNAAKVRVQRMADIQKTLESEVGDIEPILHDYAEWLDKGTDTFSFFVPTYDKKTQIKDYALLQLKKDYNISVETLKDYLLTIQSYHTQGTELPEIPCTKDSVPTFSHLFHAWTKTESTPLHKVYKKIYQIEVLRKALEDYPDWKNDAEFRTWVSSSLIHLNKGIDTLQVNEESLKKEWEKARAFLGTLEKTLLSLPALKQSIPVYDTPLPNLQADEVKRTPHISYPGIEEIKPDIKVEDAKVDEIKPPINRGFNAINEWHTYLFDAYKSKKKSDEIIESQAAQFLLHLESGTAIESQLAGLTEEEKQKKSLQLYEIANLAMTINLAAGRLTPHPSRLLGQLKAMDQMVVIAQSCDSSHFKGFTLNTDQLYWGLLDPHNDLGPFQQDIFNVLAVIEGRGKAINLATLDNVYAKDLLAVWFKNNKSSHTRYADYQSDFEGKFIPSVVAPLRSLNLLTEAFTSPHALLNGTSKEYSTRAEFKEYLHNITLQVQKGAKEAIEARKLLTISSQMEITPLHLSFKYPDYTVWDKNRKLSKELGASVSPYYYTQERLIRNNEIRQRLVEGMITNVTYPVCDIDGNFGCEVKDDHDDHRQYTNFGRQQTQYQVHQDKFIFPNTTLETSRELQEMASGRDNRATNALYTFSKNAHLLLKSDYSEDYKRVFRSLLFHGDALVRELKFNPSMANEWLGNFDRMLDTFEKTGDYNAWTFIYKAHADTCSILKSWHTPDEERVKKQAGYAQKLLNFIEKSEQKDGGLSEYRNALHLTYLYEKATQGFTEDELIQIAKSVLVAKSQIESKLNNAPFEGQPLFDLVHEVLPKLIDNIETNGTDVLTQALAYRVKMGDKKVHWQKVARGIYKTDNFYIDLNDFRIIQSGKMEGCLPKEIRENDSLKALLGEDTLKKVYNFTYVTTSLGKGWCVSLSKGSTSYTIYINNENANFPLLFRQQEGKGWEQWVRILKADESLPLDFKKGFIWASEANSQLEDPSGRILYTPHFEGDKLTLLERHHDGKKEVVLDSKDQAVFARLDSPEGFVVTKNDDKTTVSYIRGTLQYTWNTEEQKWESAVYKGYFLSSKSVQDWIPAGTQLNGRDNPFFQASFSHYHLLENKEGKAKLIVPRQYYQRGSAKELAKNELKNSLSLLPIKQENSAWQKQGFATFDMEPRGALKSNQPLDLLYLSYLLFIQGKYGRALLLLKQSQAVWTATDPQLSRLRDEIKDHILRWKDSSPNGIAFKAKFLKMEHQLKESTFGSAEAMLANDNNLLPALMNHFEAYQKNEKRVDPLLRFSKQESADISYLVPRAYHWIHEKLEKNESSPLITKEVQTYYETKKPTQEDALQWSLDKTIEALEKLPLKKTAPPKAIPPYIPVPLFDVSKWLTPIKDNEEHKAAKERIENLSGELNDIFSGTTLNDKMGKGLATDMLRHVGKVEESFTINESESLQTLLEDVLAPQEKAYLKKEKALRQSILQLFTPKKLKAGACVERQLKEQEALFDELFEQARHCFGIDDFSQLVDIHAIPKNQVSRLKGAIHSYEIARTDRQLITRKKETVARLIEDSANTILREDCAKILQEWPQYDKEKHPYAAILLLLEDELNINARTSQVQHIHKLILHPDAYIHEAMAGGKTTFLRNVFSAIESSKGHMAGVVTYAPLMAMHHKEYDKVNKQALGSSAYPFYYNRNAAHDVTAIKSMIIYHLKALKLGGRIDQTPQAIISLNHTLTELVNVLKTSDTLALKELTPSINALQKLLRLRKDCLSVYSDEIDKIFDPMKDFNYSIGQAVVLEEKYYKPGLTLVQLLMEKPELKAFTDVIKKNQLPQLSEKDFNAYLRQMAKCAFDHYKLPFNENTTLDYLTEIHQNNPERQKEMTAFYEDVVLKHANADVVLNTQMLHSFIGVLLRGMKTKMVGSDFGRSKDGISTKPYSFSAVCQETSQRSFVLSTVLEICLDYHVAGIQPEGVKAYIESIKAQSLSELTDNTTIDSTPTANKFKTRFGVTLSQAKEKDYASIANKLQSSFPLFEECLKEILLKNFTYYVEKIEGNAHHLPHLLGHFSGSSGSPERVNTLPSSINKYPDLIRQEGAIGSVFYALLKNFDEKEDMLPFDPSKPAAEQIASHLKPGDTFIDNTPFLPGKKGLEIVEDIAKASSELKAFRYLDEEDDVCIYANGQSRKGEEGINLEEVVSIIPHKGRQGTNWAFAKQKKGIVEAGVQTDLTGFYQSLMRLRLLGKGQTAKILYDTSLEKIWDERPELKGKSRLAKVIWSLVHSESPLIKQFHYQANRKEIRGIATEALDRIKTSVGDVKALIQIKELDEFKMTQHVNLDPKKCGQPVTLGAPQAVLKAMQDSEADHLQKLKDNINKLPIDASIQKTCSTIIDECLKKLSHPKLIMDASDLPENVPSPFDANDANLTEEIEIESEAATATETEQQLSLEAETELDLEQETRVDVEADKPSEHPHSEEGREWADYSMGRNWWKNVHEHKGNHDNAPIDETLFPNIMVSNYALGFYRAAISAVKPDGILARQNSLWMNNEQAPEACIASKAFIIQSPNGQMHCQLGSVKDTDFYYYEPLLEKHIAEQWHYVPYEEALKIDPSKLCKKQKDIMGWFENDLQQRIKTYDAYAKIYADVKEYNFYKVDLRETQYNKDWVPMIALAKFMYVNATFNKEEQIFLRQWIMKTCPVSVADLEKRLVSYLARYYPNSNDNQLLKIIRSIKQGER